MNWYSVMGLISSFAIAGPVLLILILGISRYRSFPVLLLYYTSVLIYNLITAGYIIVPFEVEHSWGMINNIIDAPLMILFLTYFSTSATFTQRMKILAAVLGLFELVVIGIAGFNTDAITIILGPGLLIVSGLLLFYFIRYTKHAIEKRKATGKALIITSQLFAYGCYLFIYLLYYVFKAQNDANGQPNEQYVNDTFLIFYIATTLSAILMSIGLVVEYSRIKKMKELLVTRKELNALYAETEKAVPVRTALLDFDRELWN